LEADVPHDSLSRADHQEVGAVVRRAVWPKGVAALVDAI
jgi:hypothetical protein